MPTEREKAEELLTGRIKVDRVLTMGIFQYYKWDVIRREEARHGRPLTDTEYKKIADDFSQLNWDDFAGKAEQTLSEFAKDDQKWLVPIVQGIISAFLYSVFLVIVLVIIRMNDIDVLHALRIEANQPHNKEEAIRPSATAPTAPSAPSKTERKKTTE